jgi:hypothetical protein
MANGGTPCDKESSCTHLAKLEDQISRAMNELSAARIQAKTDKSHIKKMELALMKYEEAERERET